MRSYFVPLHGRQRHILAIASRRHPQVEPLQQSLFDLIEGSGLVPSPLESPIHEASMVDQEVELGTLSLSNQLFPLHSSAGLVESLSIESKDLNLFKLTRLARVRVLWTDNVSRHLLLSRKGQHWYLELFALPCAIQGGVYGAIHTPGISAALIDEIEASYANLFNPHSPSRLHCLAVRLIGLSFWCWCLSCSSKRLRSRELQKLRDYNSPGQRRHGTAVTRSGDIEIPYDPLLLELTEREATWWDQTEFENFWPRILALDKCLQDAKPWSFWVLLRDNRDTVQYWTFLFGTIILVLTVAQVILGAMQVAGGSSSSASG
ncbi:hypothetical protein GQ53DRAFT_361285 [Thozetella sp. PMI_491]|nr:hypothetical protein GQ53DRAFT_361285 [Thozetella sp. PMI_491]